MDFQELERMYSLEASHWWFRGTRSLILRFLSTHLREDQCSRDYKILDLGCGTGITLKSLPDHFWAAGVDSSAEALEFCRKRRISRLIQSEAGALPIRSSVFEAVLALDLIEHTENDRGVVMEAVRVLRPGGLLIITVPAQRILWGDHDRALGHRRRYRIKELSRVLLHPETRIEKISYYNFFLFLPILLYRRWGRKIFPSAGSGSDLFSFPQPLNSWLFRLLRLEARLIERIRLPLGVSIVAVVRKK